jgi:quercetin dioxygenase-like cupin family protein
VVEHAALNSPVYIMVIQGTGRFTGGEGREERYGPGALLVFEPNEPHAIQAEEEPLVFIAFLHGAPLAQQE